MMFIIQKLLNGLSNLKKIQKSNTSKTRIQKKNMKMNYLWMMSMKKLVKMINLKQKLMIIT